MIKIEELKALREKKGITQSELARRAGVTQAHIAKIEAGKVDPRYSTFTKIISELLNEEKETCEKYMTKKMYYVKSNDFIRTASKLMTSKGISQIPVIESKKIIGLVSETELLYRKTNEETRIKEIMGDVPPQVSKNASVDVAKDLLHEYGAVIVVDKGVPVGIITKANFLKK